MSLDLLELSGAWSTPSVSAGDATVSLLQCHCRLYDPSPSFLIIDPAVTWTVPMLLILCVIECTRIIEAVDNAKH